MGVMQYQDPDISIKDKILNICSDLKEDNDDSYQRILAEYEFCLSTILQDLLIALVPYVESHRKRRIVSVLYSSKSDIEVPGLENLIANYFPESHIFEFEAIEWLFSFGKGMNHIQRLYNYLDREELDEMVKYNNLLKISKQFQLESTAGIIYLLGFCNVSTKCRILCSQYLLERKIPPTDTILDGLKQIAEDEREEYNTRADAADALHHYSSGELQTYAMGVLQELGGKTKNIYSNKQNIHSIGGLEKSFDYISKIIPTCTIQTISAKIMESVPEEKYEIVSASIARIVRDNAKYGESLTSSDILARVWEFIINHKDSKTLQKRLEEELIDMYDTCSSGHAIRLLNSLSGFGVELVSISFENQVISSFTGRMNAILRNIKDDEIRSAITLGMLDRGAEFVKFMTSNMTKVVEELWKEYVDEGKYMSEDEFASAIQQAIASYGSENEIEKEDMKFNVIRKE